MDWGVVCIVVVNTRATQSHLIQTCVVYSQWLRGVALAILPTILPLDILVMEVSVNMSERMLSENNFLNELILLKI